MSAQTPMGEGAKFTIEYHPEAGWEKSDGSGVDMLAIAYSEDGHTPRRPVAWQTPDGTIEDFRWLISSAAAFHHCQFEDRTEQAPTTPKVVE